jgi:hypothetical protein
MGDDLMAQLLNGSMAQWLNWLIPMAETQRRN